LDFTNTDDTNRSVILSELTDAKNPKALASDLPGNQPSRAELFVTHQIGSTIWSGEIDHGKRVYRY